MRQHGLEGDYRRGLKRAEKERWCSSPAGAMGDAGWRLRRTWIAGVVVAALALTAAACGSGTIGGRPTGTGSSGFATLPADERPVRVGHGRSFRLPAVSAAVARRAPIGGSRCRVVHDPHFGVHVELYARRLVVSVPSGIGIAPPQPGLNRSSQQCLCQVNVRVAGDGLAALVCWPGLGDTAVVAEARPRAGRSGDSRVRAG